MFLIDPGAERAEETFPAGRGVVFRYMPPSYADFVLATQAGDEAFREAVRALAEREGGEPAADVVKRLTAHSEVEADTLVMACTTGWEGVGLASGEPAPFTAEHWRAFREAWPNAAMAYVARLRAPHAAALVEGNGPSSGPDGAGPEEHASAPGAAIPKTGGSDSIAADGAGARSAREPDTSP